MFEMGASAGTAAALIVISFVSYVAGLVLGKWPEKVREYVEGIDGSVAFLTEQAHRALTRLCSRALLGISFAALLAAALVL